MTKTEDKFLKSYLDATFVIENQYKDIADTISMSDDEDYTYVEMSFTDCEFTGLTFCLPNKRDTKPAIIFYEPDENGEETETTQEYENAKEFTAAVKGVNIILNSEKITEAA